MVMVTVERSWSIDGWNCIGRLAKPSTVSAKAATPMPTVQMR